MAHLEAQRVGGEMHHYVIFDSGDEISGFGNDALSKILQRLDEDDHYEITEATNAFVAAETPEDTVLAFRVDEKAPGAGLRDVVVSTSEASQFIGSFFCLMEGGINQRVACTTTA